MLLSQTDISPWLEAKPDLKKVEDVRATIENQRLQLRQKLADKKDLEEVGLKYTIDLERRLKYTKYLEGAATILSS